MDIPRIIPVLLIQDKRLVKTVRFKDPVYIGDPINTVRILCEKNIPELIVLDISATKNNSMPNYDMIAQIAGECSVPLIYGGGITSTDIAAKVFACGIEKVVLNTAVIKNPQIISGIASVYGSQSVVVSMDVRKDAKGSYSVFAKNGRRDTQLHPVTYARRAQELGCGEVFMNNIDLDGTFSGYDTTLIKNVSSALHIPLIACGGAGHLTDLHLALQHGASAAAAGSLFCFSGRHRAVLINFPSGLYAL